MRRHAILTLSGALGGGAVLFAAVSLAPSACTTHQCDPSRYVWPPGHDALPDGGVIVGGYMLDENTYVSNDRNENWLDFRGNTTIQLYFPPQAACRAPKNPSIEIGTSQTPNSRAAFEDGSNYTTSAGQPAILNELNTDPIFGPDGGVEYGGGLLLTNSSCAEYFVHVEVDFAETEAATDDPCRNGGGGVVSVSDAAQNSNSHGDALEVAPDAGIADAGAE